MNSSKSVWKNFPATKDNYYTMLDYVMSIAEEYEMSDRQQVKLELGFEEAAANVINYAYGERDNGKISIRAFCDDDIFFVELKDNGIAFNPLAASREYKQPTTLEDAKIGGLGIPFMQRIFDEMTYHYGKDGDLFCNKLTLGIKLVSN